MADDIITQISIGDKGDVVDIDISLIGSVRGFKLMDICRKERTPSYFSDILLIAAEGHVTPHSIDADWLEENVTFQHAVDACTSIIDRTTEKNTTSPASTT